MLSSYETTSSEESSGEENEDEKEEEVDSSEPEEQGEEKESGAAQEEAAAAAGEQADEAQAKGSKCSEEPQDLEASIGPQEEQPVRWDRGARCKKGEVQN